MEFRVAKLSLRSSLLLAIGLLTSLASISEAQREVTVVTSFVEDNASLLEAGVRAELNSDLISFRETTDCWILVKTLTDSIDKKGQRQIFGKAWKSWGRPRCAVAFFFIRESTSARMTLAPGMETRLSHQEIGAILRGVVVPRFTVEDPEGAVVAGVESLRIALSGELEELPSAFRSRGGDTAIGAVLLVLAFVAIAAGLFQVLVAIRERSPSRSRTP